MCSKYIYDIIMALLRDGEKPKIIKTIIASFLIHIDASCIVTFSKIR